MFEKFSNPLRARAILKYTVFDFKHLMCSVWPEYLQLSFIRALQLPFIINLNRLKKGKQKWFIALNPPRKLIMQNKVSSGWQWKIHVDNN